LQPFLRPWLGFGQTPAPFDEPTDMRPVLPLAPGVVDDVQHGGDGGRIRQPGPGGHSIARQGELDTFHSGKPVPC
jgi:hypothetical protein